MAKRIDEIDWASLSDAYGPADYFPQMLQNAVDPDPDVREEALHDLFGTIYHQGTLYSATPHAVPFIVRAAADPATPDRAGLIHLLGRIAETGDASLDVIADVEAALVRDIDLMLPFLDDPDAEARHIATLLLGHLPQETAAQVLPALRTRRTVEQEPIVVAGLLAAAGRIAPETSAEWLAEEIAPGRPDTVRAGALWATAAAGLPWTDASTEAFTECWLNGDPFPEYWVWSDRPYEDISQRLDARSLAAVSRAILAEGTAEAASAAVNAMSERCLESRAARADLAPLLAEAVEHPDPGIRLQAAGAVLDVREAAPLAVEALAAQASRITSSPVVRAAPPDDGFTHLSEDDRLLSIALDILITLGDARWREPLVLALDAGARIDDALGTLIDADVPCDDALLGAVRRRIAAWWAGQGQNHGCEHCGDPNCGSFATMSRHNEINTLTRLVHHWGPDAAEAVPDLVPLVPDDNWWTVRALGAIGAAASEAVPALTRVRDTSASWKRRLECAEAIAAITGDVAQLSACVTATAVTGDGDPSLAVQTALRHGLPVDDLLPALRATATRVTDPDDLAAFGKRIVAAGLLLDQGEADPAMRAAADAFDQRTATAEALELAGRFGRAAAGEFEQRVRACLGDPLHDLAAARALHRITGESEPLVAAVRRRLAWPGAGGWLEEPLRELGPDAAELLPELRRLADGDGPASRFGSYGRKIHEEEQERARLLALLADLDA
ncbi:hypothetical protein AB0L06_02875 [Spirillospora sp. NPDC052269]